MTRTVGLKLLVSVCLIGWLFWRIPLAAIDDALRSIEPFSACLALELTLVAWWVSAVRLWCIAPEFRLRDVVLMTFVALYYGTVLPGQVAGDVVKAHRLSKRQIEAGQAVAATLVDRVVATFALFFLGACAAPWVDRAPRGLTSLLVVAAVSVLIGATVLAQPRAHALLTGWVQPNRPARIRTLLGRFIDGLHRVLQHPPRLFACFMLALIFHGLCTAIQIELARAIGFHLPISAWFLAYAAVALLLLLPVSIAGLGLREGGYVGMLGLFGVAAPQALALSLMLFAYTLFGAMLGWLADLAERSPR